MTQISERINGLSPEQMDTLMRKLRGGKASVSATTISARTASKKRMFDSHRDENYQLEIDKRGIFDSMSLKLSNRVLPKEGEVEIDVKAAGINFRDVMVALGSYPTAPGFDQPEMGVDCAGEIVAVGPGVDNFRIGDAVMCMSQGTFKKYLTVHAACLMPKPPGFTFEQAAGVPCVFATVQYAMVDIARLAPGESILIHSAAGGVGLAAIQVANHIGAKIIATIGTPEKREFLKSIGIEHIFDSRSLSFAEDVLRVTNGRGVDAVLNSLAGEALVKSFEILAPGGRFLELGKRDLAANNPIGMFPFLRGASFTGIDLGLFAPERNPKGATRLYGGLGEIFKTGSYKPLPIQTFVISDAAVAFSSMMMGKHIGKFVLTFPTAGVPVVETR